MKHGKLAIKLYTSIISRAWDCFWQHAVYSSLLFGVSSPTFHQSVSQLFLRTAEFRPIGLTIKTNGRPEIPSSKLISLIAGLTYWTDDAYSEHQLHSYAYYASIYALLQICGLISLLLLGVALFIVSVKRAGAKLHQEALRTLIQAPLQYFTKTDTGVITNLFSQDLNLIDTELPDATLNTMFCVCILQTDNNWKSAI